MKRIITLLSIIVLLSGCTDYVQVVNINPATTDISKVYDKFYQYENDDLIVRYSFWGEHGIMAFLIYNTSDKPIYIDWKRSSMINGQKQYRYYVDKTTSNYLTYSASYGVGWAAGFNGYSIGEAYSDKITVGTETIVKSERRSFIAPKAYIVRAFYNLTGNIYFDVSQSTTAKKKIGGVDIYVTTSNFDIKFRNYLTYSDDEEFKTERHVDNGFQVGKVYTMKDYYFGEIRKDGSITSDWYKPSRFYVVDLPDKQDLFNTPPDGKTKL